MTDDQPGAGIPIAQLTRDPASALTPDGDCPGDGEGSRTRRGGWLIAIAVIVAVIVAAGGIVWRAREPHYSVARVALPSALLGLRRDTNPSAQHLADELATMNQKEAQRGMSFPSILATSYDDPAGHVLLLAVGHWCPRGVGCVLVSGQLTLQAEKANGHADATMFPLGSRGGWINCFSYRVPTGSATECAWFDQVTAGDAVFGGGFASSLADAAAKTRQIRDAIES